MYHYLPQPWLRPNDEVLANIVIGIDTRASVEDALGMPTTGGVPRANSITEDILKNSDVTKDLSGSGETEYKASHILVETEQKARDLLTLLDSGTDFGGLAIEHSTGPSGPSGGDLGWFGKGQMVAPFESAVMGMGTGTYTGPVKTQFGYHLIFLNNRRETSPPSFEDVRGEIEVEVQNAAVETHLRGLMANADVVMPAVKIDPSVLSVLDFTSK